MGKGNDEGRRNVFKGKTGFSGNVGTEFPLEMSQWKRKTVFRISLLLFL